MSGICWCFIVTRQVFSKRWIDEQSAFFPVLSFSEDDCTRQRGLKAVVQSSIERTVSGVRCTNDDLKPVLVALATDQPLDVRYRDHDLSGDWAGYRECHIKPDLLLIYRKSDADTLRLARLGSHSELFG
ncbi:type II toxin-antitoxin system YafQ family toxin [Serratia marcescens]|uniref:type II toxin-antitoxin system YafQ family toxin n=1 Tax=Serratia marcescens TaxID=615 RepID=UPI003EC823CF